MVKIISCLVEIVDELLKEDAFDPFDFRLELRKRSIGSSDRGQPVNVILVKLAARIEYCRRVRDLSTVRSN